MPRTIVSIRDSQNIPFLYAKKNPSTAAYFDNTQITSVSAQVIKPDGTTLAPTNAITFTYTTATGGFKGYVANWDAASDLNAYPWVTVIITPVRVGIAAALSMPKEMELDLSDLAKRQDETEAKIDVLQTDFNAFEVTNQTEHDQTQSQLSTVGAAAESQLFGPTTFPIPDAGSSTFVLEFVLKDIDTSPVALVDPDSDIVDVDVINQAGGAPTGVTLAGAPAGRMTRVSAGRYTLAVNVASTAGDVTQLRFTASYARSAVSNVAKWGTMLGDFDQLDTIESQVNAIRSTDVPLIAGKEDAIKAVVDAIRATDVPAIQANIEAKGDEIEGTGFNPTTDTLEKIRDAIDAIPTSNPSTAAIADAVWDEATSGHVAAGSFGKLTQDTKTVVDETEQDVDDLQADFDAFETINQAEHDATQSDIADVQSAVDLIRSTDVPNIQANIDQEGTDTRTEIDTQVALVLAQLSNGTYGLSALNTDLDAILTRLGITTDTGGSSSAGTAMAKLNALLLAVGAAATSLEIDLTP